MNRLGRPQLPAPWAICGSNSKQIDRGVPEIRDLGYFKRINGLRFWCLQNPLKIATFWDPPNFAKSCPANFAAVKKFRVRNNEHVAPSALFCTLRLKMSEIQRLDGTCHGQCATRGSWWSCSITRSCSRSHESLLRIFSRSDRELDFDEILRRISS